jgi:hypothetical protein
LATRKINTKEMPKILTTLDQPRLIKKSPEFMCVNNLGAICPLRVTSNLDRIQTRLHKEERKATKL